MVDESLGGGASVLLDVFVGSGGGCAMVKEEGQGRRRAHVEVVLNR